MSKSAQIKEAILKARESGDNKLEMRLLADLHVLRGKDEFKDSSIETAYGLMADSP